MTRALQFAMHSYMQNQNKSTIRGLADAKLFQYLKEQYPVFFKESCNLVLKIAADSFNPWALRSSAYLITPVMIVIYNLPMELTTKYAFNLLTLIILEKHQIKNMDIFLRHLVDEFKILWSIGFVVRHISRLHKDHARLYEILICTFHDYVDLGHISGSYNIFILILLILNYIHKLFQTFCFETIHLLQVKYLMQIVIF